MSIKVETIARGLWAVIAGALLASHSGSGLIVGAAMLAANIVEIQWGEWPRDRKAKVTINQTGSGEVTPQAVVAAMREFEGRKGETG